MTPPRHDRADPVPQRQFRRAALDYAAHGWPVVPAAHFDGRRYVCVQVDCEEDGPHPVWRLWQDRASTDPATVSSWYRLFSFAVALATGVVFDVLELPESAAIRVQAALTEAGHTTPVAVWRERECRLFWTRPGLDPAAVTVPGARVRGAGNWVSAPPTPTRRGAVQWAVSPEQAEWQPVEPAALIAALALAGVAGDAVR